MVISFSVKLILPVSNTPNFLCLSTDLHCCDNAPSDTCKSTCRTLLQTEVTEQAIVDGLVKACGDVKPHEPLWRCFFFGQAPEEEQRPSLSSPWVLKKQCCQRAVSDNCKRLCNLVHTRPWEGPQRWDQFERHCDYGSSNEVDLNQCLQEGKNLKLSLILVLSFLLFFFSFPVFQNQVVTERFRKTKRPKSTNFMVI